MFLLVVLLGACETPAPGDPAEPDDLAQLTPYQRDLEPKLRACVACHQGSEPQGGLDLTDLRAATVDQPSGQGELPLITPGNHRQSYLWHKVNGSQGIAGGLGARMPVGVEWSEDDVDLLARWIDLGLPE